MAQPIAQLPNHSSSALSPPSSPPSSALPCLTSSPPCLQQLSQLAIAASPEITAIDQRLELVGKQIGLQYDRRWTAFLPLLPIGPTGLDFTKLNPLQWISTLFGGGSVREVDVKITELELRASDLVRRRAELIASLSQEVTGLVLGYEKLDRQIQLLESQIETQRQRQAVLEVRYRVGEGSTVEMLGIWEKAEQLAAKRLELQIEQQKVIGTLLLQCGLPEAL